MRAAGDAARQLGPSHASLTRGRCCPVELAPKVWALPTFWTGRIADISNRSTSVPRRCSHRALHAPYWKTLKRSFGFAALYHHEPGRRAQLQNAQVLTCASPFPDLDRDQNKRRHDRYAGEDADRNESDVSSSKPRKVQRLGCNEPRKRVRAQAVQHWAIRVSDPAFTKRLIQRKRRKRALTKSCEPSFGRSRRGNVESS